MRKSKVKIASNVELEPKDLALIKRYEDAAITINKEGYLTRIMHFDVISNNAIYLTFHSSTLKTVEFIDLNQDKSLLNLVHEVLNTNLSDVSKSILISLISQKVMQNNKIDSC